MLMTQTPSFFYACAETLNGLQMNYLALPSQRPFNCENEFAHFHCSIRTPLTWCKPRSLAIYKGNAAQQLLIMLLCFPSFGLTNYLCLSFLYT